MKWVADVSFADASTQTTRLKAQTPRGRVMGMHGELDAIASGSQTRTSRRNREPGCLARALFLGLAIPIERMPIVFPGGAGKRGIGRDGERVGGAAQHGDVGMVIAKRA